MLICNSDIVHIDKQFVLERARQEEIFRYYMRIPLELEFQFCSPLRTDENPTCSMGYFGEKLLFRDWSESRALDCFDFVMRKFMIPYGQALERVVSDLGLKDREPNEDLPEEFKSSLFTGKRKSNKKIIKVRVQGFRKSDIQYLKSFHITKRVTEKFKCFSIEHIWLQGKPHYRYRDVDPALGYYLGDDENSNQRWKIYFYLRSSGGGRFMGNTNRINGWIQLPDYGDVLVITKSMKDVMVLDMFGISAIAMQSETTLPYQRIIDDLSGRFNTIYSLYDFDYAGIKGALKMRRKFGIEPLFLSNGRFRSKNFKSKDISDFIKDYGINNTLTLLKYAAERLSISIDLKYNNE